MISYVTSCHVAPTWPSRFDPTSTNSTVKLENVIQYFRASSFALASPAYNNTFAHTSNSETKDSTPLPDFIEHSPFRECIGDVTENALAIMSKPPKTVFPDYLIVVFVFLGGGMFGLAVTILIYTCLLVFAIKRCLWSGPFAYLSELLDQLFEMKKRKQEARRRQTEAIAGERRQEFVYERYP
ncbi:hypothetical protein FRB91_007103 [Serendipita sp. 411]|nr:hypothetical protein FRB91_007103 [Serendipita sp. 411]